MSDNFEWTDALVREYGEWYRNTQGKIALVDADLWGKDLFEYFKKSKEKDIPKDWEIQCIQIDNRNCWLQKDGLYKSGLYEKGSTSDFLLKSRGVIHSVKRNDGEVFNIGISTDRGVIRKFEISGVYMVAFFENSDTFCNIVGLEKVKPKVPLFTTEDGVEIFDRSIEVIGIERKTGIVVTGSGNSIGTWTNGWYTTDKIKNPTENDQNVLSYIREKYVIFFSKEKANEYILLNKPIEVSYSQIKEILNQRSSVAPYIYENIKEFFKSKINL